MWVVVMVTVSRRAANANANASGVVVVVVVEDEGVMLCGLDKYVVFYGCECVWNEGGLELMTAASAGARTEMDSRTAFTFVLL